MEKRYFSMAKVTVYKNSKFATFISFLGYLAIILGIYAMFNDEVAGGIIALVVGIGLKLLAGFISKKKSEKEAAAN